MNGDILRPCMMALLAMALTFVALYVVVLAVDVFGTWGFWLSTNAAVILPIWMRLRSRVN